MRGAEQVTRRLARAAERGFTFVEMLVVVALVSILAAAVVPLAKVTMQRQREIELRRALREIRTAIDHYKDAVDGGQIPATRVRPGSEGYPPDLETLVVGVQAAGQGTTERKLKFLRRIPIDPMTREASWGMRSYEDRPDSKPWGGGNVYDVYSKSDGTALDGTKYQDW
jgi:general secretion pathway protein G